jgi:uncharacterized protein (TIGR00725 family)
MQESDALSVLTVLGAGDATPDEKFVAERVGKLAARHGWVVLTGGGPGVMAAASRGAIEAGGLTVGVMPTSGRGAGYPNRWVAIPIYTGVGDARNVFNVLSGTLCVAIGGGAGTLSEIAHALKLGAPIWCWRSWNLDPPGGRRIPVARSFDDAEEFLQALELVLRKGKPEEGLPRPD